MVFLMISQVAYSALLTTTGMISSMSFVGTLHFSDLKLLSSICEKLRNAAPGYNFTETFFLCCLYEDEQGDPDSPEDGFLKGPLLLCVSPSPLCLCCMDSKQ
jgi:hypothetical protein